jgi:diacylglycerol kinase family enzyme
MLAGASTVPFYGMGLRLFPHADKVRGLMHLRVATDPAMASLLMNIHRIWVGEYATDKILDFHAEQVTLRFEAPMPLQIGGDAEGFRESITFGMAREPVELVDFRIATA